MPRSPAERAPPAAAAGERAPPSAPARRSRLRLRLLAPAGSGSGARPRAVYWLCARAQPRWRPREALRSARGRHAEHGLRGLHRAQRVQSARRWPIDDRRRSRRGLLKPSIAGRAHRGVVAPVSSWELAGRAHNGPACSQTIHVARRLEPPYCTRRRKSQSELSMPPAVAQIGGEKFAPLADRSASSPSPTGAVKKTKSAAWRCAACAWPTFSGGEMSTAKACPHGCC